MQAAELAWYGFFSHTSEQCDRREVLRPLYTLVSLSVNRVRRLSTHQYCFETSTHEECWAQTGNIIRAQFMKELGGGGGRVVVNTVLWKHKEGATNSSWRDTEGSSLGKMGLEAQRGEVTSRTPHGCCSRPGPSLGRKPVICDGGGLWPTDGLWGRGVPLSRVYLGSSDFFSPF